MKCATVVERVVNRYGRVVLFIYVLLSLVFAIPLHLEFLSGSLLCFCVCAAFSLTTPRTKRDSASFFTAEM